MSKLGILINILGYIATIIFFSLIYYFLELVNATDLMFKLFWWYVIFTIIINVLIIIRDIKQSGECDEYGE